jgi:predicted DNA-binding protein with PD1-like motif
MKYQTGRAGRIIVAKFGDDDDILVGLREIAAKEDIRAALFHLVGGIRQGRLVVGPETDELPPKPVWKELGESHELLATGTIFWQGNEPKIHLHGAFGKHDRMKIGCLREDARSFIVIEAVIIEIEGIEACREIDPAVGMPLLNLG